MWTGRWESIPAEELRDLVGRGGESATTPSEVERATEAGPGNRVTGQTDSPLTARLDVAVEGLTRKSRSRDLTGRWYNAVTDTGPESRLLPTDEHGPHADDTILGICDRHRVGTGAQ